ncbi:unnamed protein product, partial [Sphacelaria rigidula]
MTRRTRGRMCTCHFAKANVSCCRLDYGRARQVSCDTDQLTHMTSSTASLQRHHCRAEAMCTCWSSGKSPRRRVCGARPTRLCNLRLAIPTSNLWAQTNRPKY